MKSCSIPPTMMKIRSNVSKIIFLSMSIIIFFFFSVWVGKLSKNYIDDHHRSKNKTLHSSHFTNNDNDHDNDNNTNNNTEYRDAILDVNKSHDVSIYLYRINARLDTMSPSLMATKTIQEVMDCYSDTIQYADSYHASNFIMFESLNNVDLYIDRLGRRKSWPEGIRYIMGIQGTDLLVSKSALAKRMKTRIKRSLKTPSYTIPETYIVNDPVEVARFQKEYDPYSYYILKKNIQRQQGFVITNNISVILDHIDQKDKKFVVCQKMLQDPFLINDRKINLRVYLLITIEGPNVKWYHFTNGFIYYTPEVFKQNSTNQNNVITSGYVDRKIYENNPMTHLELMDTIGIPMYEVMQENIRETLGELKRRYSTLFRDRNIDIPGIKFSLFGCDLAPDKEMRMSLLEINKGPDLNYKDERDRAVKYSLISSMFERIGILSRDESKKDEDKGEEEHDKNAKYRISRFIEIP